MRFSRNQSWENVLVSRKISSKRIPRLDLAHMPTCVQRAEDSPFDYRNLDRLGLQMDSIAGCIPKDEEMKRYAWQLAIGEEFLVDSTVV